MRETIKILGIPIDNVTINDVSIITKKLIEESNKTCKMIFAPNVEFIMTAQKDKDFFEILQESSLSTPDSIGVMIGAKLQKKKFKQRIPGQAYFRKIIETGEKEGWTFYFLGGSEDVVKRTKENIEKLYPKIKIIGYNNGFLNEETEKAVIDEINDLKPNVLFVAMGAPKQEKWIYNHRQILKVDVATGQGGTFDYEAGRIKRAPIFIQKIGMEWLWRLMKEPKRIIRMRVLPIYLLKVLLKKDKSKGRFD